MFQVRSDSGKNRLYITLAGHLEAAERHAAIQAILAEAGKLDQGFDVITDISALHAANEAGFRDLLRAKSVLQAKGVGRIIRVVRIPISRIQFERVSGAAGYEAEEADSLEDAERMLDHGLTRQPMPTS